MGAGLMALRPAVRRLLPGGIMPLWLGGGLADWRTGACIGAHISRSAFPAGLKAEVPRITGGGLGSDASVWQSPEQVARDRRGLGTGSADG